MVAALVSIPATGTVDLGTQLPVALDGSAPFSIGLWVQLEDPQATGTLASTSAFTLGVAAGVPYATLVGQSAIPTSAPTPVPAGSHYLVVTFDNSGPNILSLYLDTLLIASGPITNPVGANGSVTLGGGAAFTLWCANFYNIALSEEAAGYNWSPGTPAPGLVASYCFCNLPANEPIAQLQFSYAGGARQLVHTPAASFPGGGWLAPASDAGIVGPSHQFTLQASVYLPPDSSPQGVVVGYGQIDTRNGVALFIQPSNTGVGGTVMVFNGTDIVEGGFIPTGEWHNVAATFDGQTLALYLDFLQVVTQSSRPVTLKGANNVLVGAAPTGAAPGVTYTLSGVVQTVDIWNVALTASQLAQYQNSIPVETTGCIASFDLSGTPIEDLTDTPLSSINGVTPLDLYITPPSELSAQAHGAAGARISGDVSSAPDAETRFAPLEIPALAIDQAVAALEEMLPSSLPPQTRESWLASHRAQLEAVRDQVATGARPAGMFSHRREGDEWVILYHGDEGISEVARAPVAAGDKCGGWYISLGSTILLGILGLFGVPLSSRRVALALARYFTRYPRTAQAVSTAFQEEITARTIIGAMRVLYLTGGLTGLVSEILSQLSWWDWLFFFGSVMIGIVELVVPNPSTAVWVAFMATKMAFLIGQIVTVCADKPSGC